MSEAPPFPVCEHPERPRRALGLCLACYFRWRRRVIKARMERIRETAALLGM